MGAKESVEAAAKMNADGWGHVEVCIIYKKQSKQTNITAINSQSTKLTSRSRIFMSKRFYLSCRSNSNIWLYMVEGFYT